MVWGRQPAKALSWLFDATMIIGTLVRFLTAARQSFKRSMRRSVSRIP